MKLTNMYVISISEEDIAILVIEAQLACQHNLFRMRLQWGDGIAIGPDDQLSMVK